MYNSDFRRCRKRLECSRPYSPDIAFGEEYTSTSTGQPMITKHTVASDITTWFRSNVVNMIRRPVLMFENILRSSRCRVPISESLGRFANVLFKFTDVVDGDGALYKYSHH